MEFVRYFPAPAALSVCVPTAEQCAAFDLEAVAADFPCAEFERGAERADNQKNLADQP
jgi:hypothetical protein